LFEELVCEILPSTNVSGGRRPVHVDGDVRSIVDDEKVNSGVVTELIEEGLAFIVSFSTDTVGVVILDQCHHHRGEPEPHRVNVHSSGVPSSTFPVA
jgi:hypothetical protein